MFLKRNSFKPSTLNPYAMKKSLLILSIYWVSLLNKADAQTRKFFYEPGSDVYCDWNIKPHQKNSRWNSTSTLLLSMRYSVSDRIILFNNAIRTSEDKSLR